MKKSPGDCQGSFLFGNLKKPELVPVLCGRINLLRKKKVLRDNLQEK